MSTNPRIKIPALSLSRFTMCDYIPLPWFVQSMNHVHLLHSATKKLNIDRALQIILIS